MSDEEDFMMSDADSYEFEFEDDDSVDEVEMSDDKSDDNDNDPNGDNENDVESENDENSAEALYISAKHLKLDDPELGIATFKKLLELPTEDNESELFKFKAIKQIIKVDYSLKNNADLNSFKLFESIDLDKLEDKYYVEESFNKLFETFIGYKEENLINDLTIIQYFMDTFSSVINDKLYIKLQLKTISIYLKQSKTQEVLDILKDLYERASTFNSMIRSSLNLEFLSIEIQVYLLEKNYTKLKELYTKTLSIQSTIPHPKINATIKECAGLMSLKEEYYEGASLELFESFKNYDEIGDNFKRIYILKILILTSILSNSSINKFESQEIKFFLKNDEIISYLKLLKSFDLLKFNDFNEIYDRLTTTESNEIILELLQKILDKLKFKLLLHYIKPFKKLSLQKLSNYLKITIDDIEMILINLKNNNKLGNVKLDLIDGIIYNE